MASIAGTACATEVFAQLDPDVQVDWLVDDGGLAGEGAKIGYVTGPLRSCSPESGPRSTSCATSRALPPPRTASCSRPATRCVCSTPARRCPALRSLEKAAVRAGGGVNHRGSLSDLVLLKDNHLAGIGITAAVQRAHDLWPGRAVEVECDRIAQVEEAISAGASMVLLDNMTPDEIRACVALVRRSAAPHGRRGLGWRDARERPRATPTPAPT